MDINKVKLLIWDLDETFWKGTLSEEDVCPISENIKIVKELVDRGIMNSIVSKNDPQKAIEVLKSWNIFDLFVFPRISWQPKGEIVYKLLNEMKLRAENVVFVDDNPSNIAEVEYYNKGICCIYPEELSELLSCPACKGKDDKQHLRLQQYHNMEKQSEARTHYSSNEDFLRSSHIKIQICYDCLNVEDRIYELIERTNQLNYTKNRCSLEKLHRILQDKMTESRYIKVKDDYGDYGIIGFYSLRQNELIHFLFSCRTLGLGVEHYIYKKLGCPKVEVVGDVASPLYPLQDVDWIEQVNYEKEDVAIDKHYSMLLVGGCDLEQTKLYLQGDFSIDTEFATVIKGNEIRTSDTCSLVNTLELNDVIKKEISTYLPFMDYDITFGTKMFEGRYDVIVLSVVDDYIRGMYRHNVDKYYVGFGGYFDQENAFAMYPSGDFSYFEKNFTFVGKEDARTFEKNLKFIIDNIPRSTFILLINGIDLDVSDWIGKDRVDRNIEMNMVVDKVVEEYPNVSLIDMRKIVTSKTMLNKHDNRHFNRQVYYNLAKMIIEKCDLLINLTGEIQIKNMEDVATTIRKDNFMINVKSFLRRCGVKNPLPRIRMLVRKYQFWKYNKKFSKIDYFDYETLIKMPDFVGLPVPFEDDISYGMFRPARNLYNGKINLDYDYIEHGLCYAEAAPNLLNILSYKPIGKIFTYSNRRKEQLEKLMSRAGYHNEVIALGPIIPGASNFYSQSDLSNIKKKLGKTLLVFPMHSWPGVENEFDNDEFVQEIERLKPQFETILVCLYYMDIRRGKHKPFVEKGYTIVCNGSRFDTYFISRHRDLIEISDVTMSNGIGTHVGYSICLNRPHYYFKQKMKQTISSDYSAESPEQDFRVGFEEEFVKVFGEFSFEITEAQKDFVRLYWGDF